MWSSPLSRFKTFRHGVHPHEHKEPTNALPIERMPFVEEYVLHLSQHLGAPSRPIVSPGQRVERGQMIAAPGGFVSTALHSPVTGTVAAIERRLHPNGSRTDAIVVTTDAYSSQQWFDEHPPKSPLEGGELVAAIQQAGIVGLGGAAFPSHVKLNVPDGKNVRFVILNGCECEPYLTCDHRIMVERADAVVKGLRIMMRQLGVERGYIGVEKNKPDAIEALTKEAGSDGSIEVVALAVKYPQGAEKMLIDAIFKKEVPSGGLPLDIEMVVHNVGTAAALTDLTELGRPLVERVVTVTGPGIKRPANVMVPLGTPLEAVIEHCGGLLPNAKQVILGGPMMGMAQKSLDVPTIKGASGILVLTKPAAEVREEPCIKCGRCLEACPMFLNPSRLALVVRAERVEQMKVHHILDCFECASCSFSCPSRIPLVQLIRMGKAMVRQMKDS